MDQQSDTDQQAGQLTYGTVKRYWNQTEEYVVMDTRIARANDRITNFPKEKMDAFVYDMKGGISHMGHDMFLAYSQMLSYVKSDDPNKYGAFFFLNAGISVAASNVHDTVSDLFAVVDANTNPEMDKDTRLLFEDIHDVMVAVKNVCSEMRRTVHEDLRGVILEKHSRALEDSITLLKAVEDYVGAEAQSVREILYSNNVPHASEKPRLRM